jgi:ATP-dependent Lon protease
LVSLRGRSTERKEISSEEDFEVPALFSDDVVLLPYMEVSLSMSDTSSRDAILDALSSRRLLAMIPSNGYKVGEVGTLALLSDQKDRQGGIPLKGLWRISVKEVTTVNTGRRVKFSRVEGFKDFPPGAMEAVIRVHRQVKEFAEMMPSVPREVISFVMGIESPGKLADVCAGSPLFDSRERLGLLNTLDPVERLEMVSERLERDLGSMRELARPTSISNCETCMDFADRALESVDAMRNGVVAGFLEHLVEKHSAELIGLVAEKYGPSFMQKRSLR